jgi:hypothetical protein
MAGPATVMGMAAHQLSPVDKDFSFGICWI